MPNKKEKILGIGSPIVDILVSTTDNFIAENVSGDKGGMELVDISVINSILSKITSEEEIVPGGSAANTIEALSKLGISTGFLGKIADDQLGRFYKEHYKKIGCDINQFKISKEVETGRCLSLVTPDSERTMRTFLGAAATIQPEDISIEDFKGYTHLHIEGYMLHNHAVIKKALKLAKSLSLTVSLDLASFEVVKLNMEILPDLLQSYVDIVFCNEDEAMQYCNSEDPKNILSTLDGVCDIIALKLGKAGSVIKTDTEEVSIEAEIVEAVDTTGAGDLWQAGFLYKYINSRQLSGKLLEKAGGFGSLLGAEIVKIKGASIPEDRWDYIRGKLN
ncbi:MAG TPA: adenosine kinase [Victivallales bacterium]|nr:adenosine kinase [Victivallales bacterium]